MFLGDPSKRECLRVEGEKIFDRGAILNTANAPFQNVLQTRGGFIYGHRSEEAFPVAGLDQAESEKTQW